MNENTLLSNDLSQVVANSLKTIIDEHPKAARVVTLGGLTALFGYMLIYEVLH